VFPAQGNFEEPSTYPYTYHELTGRESLNSTECPQEFLNSKRSQFSGNFSSSFVGASHYRQGNGFNFESAMEFSAIPEVRTPLTNQTPDMSTVRGVENNSSVLDRGFILSKSHIGNFEEEEEERDSIIKMLGNVGHSQANVRERFT
jgi:hypothetical protein